MFIYFSDILIEESKQESKEEKKEVVESIEVEDLSTMKKTIYLKTSMICYVCKKEVNEVHHFYDQVYFFSFLLFSVCLFFAKLSRCALLVAILTLQNEIKQLT